MPIQTPAFDLYPNGSAMRDYLEYLQNMTRIPQGGKPYVSEDVDKVYAKEVDKDKKPTTYVIKSPEEFVKFRQYPGINHDELENMIHLYSTMTGHGVPPKPKPPDLGDAGNWKEGSGFINRY
jgi:hypothetical protein